MMKLNHLFSGRRGQATTETVLLFPVLIIFMLFIIKIFGLLVLSQKVEIAGFYAARRYQLQSHMTDSLQRWDRRFLEKDIKKKVEEYLGFNNAGMRRFLSLKSFDLDINTSGTWHRVVLTVRTRAPHIKFLCDYDKQELCQNEMTCYKGFEFLCETGGQIQVIKYIGPNERVLPWMRPD